ncbi:MAG: immunoglobulin-like domain-containing protein [Candidatus Pacearchaeota archaeon]|jgi:hypothetical protein
MKTKKQNTKVALGLLLITLTIIALEGSILALDTTTPITLSTIGTHNSIANCWTALDGKVYNLSPYIGSHPGGSAISVLCGKDGSTILDAKHSLSYAAMVSSYQIGVLSLPDTISPVITILGSNPINLKVGDVYTDLKATASDNIDGDLTSKIITVNSVDTSLAGTYIVKYSVSDNSGNSAEAKRTVIISPVILPNPDPTPTPNPEPNSTPNPVVDNKKPKLRLNGKSEIKLRLGDNYTDLGATAIDNIDGDLTSKIIVSGTVNTSLPGKYIIKYTVTDKAGNTAKIKRIVVVKKEKSKIEKHEKNETEKENHENETEKENEKEVHLKEKKNSDNVNHEKEKETESKNKDNSKLKAKKKD